MFLCAALIADLAATIHAVIAESDQLRNKEMLSIHVLGKACTVPLIAAYNAPCYLDAIMTPIQQCMKVVQQTE